MGYGRKLLAGLLAGVMAVYAGAGSGLGVIAEDGGLTGVMQGLVKAGDTANDYSSLQYTVYDDHVEITGCTDTAITFIDIPAEIDGVPVTVIGEKVFQNHSFLSAAAIPDSVTTIGDFAFDGTALSAVLFGENVVSIGSCAFRNTKLAEVVIPEHIASLGVGAFSDCKELESAALLTGDGATGLFSRCSKLREVTLSENVKRIEQSTFNACTSLETIDIPDSVLSIGITAFQDCTALREVKLSQNLYMIDYQAFSNCTELESIILPDSLCTIKGGVFTNCDSLTTVVISKNITVENGTSAPFVRLPNLTYAVVPDSVEDPSSLFYECENLVIVSSVEELPDLTIMDVSMELISLPDKTVYLLEEELDLTGISINVRGVDSYSDGRSFAWEKENAPLDMFEVSGFDSSASGEQIITISFQESYQSETGVMETVSLSFPIRVLKKSTLTYHPNGGSGEPEAQIAAQGDELSIPNVIPSYEGYLFRGWSDSPNGTVKYAVGDSLVLHEDIILYAVWILPDEADNIITFDPNGGTGEPEPQVKEWGLALILSEVCPEREGCIFQGWALRPNGSAIFLPGDYYRSDLSVTLYAVWRTKCVFCANSGTVPEMCSDCEDGYVTGSRPCSSCGGKGSYSTGVCSKCGGDGRAYYAGIGDLPCLSCSGTGYNDGNSAVRCEACGGKGSSTIISECTNCSGNVWIEAACPECDGGFTTAEVPETDTYIYQVEVSVPEFCFAHDTQTNFVTSVTRCTLNPDYKEFRTPEPLTNWNSITLKGTTPAEQFSGQSGLHDLVFECTDEYGTLEIPAPASAYIGAKGDANMDGEANAADAAAILVYAAECGASGSAVLYSDTDETMEQFSLFLADVNGEATDSGTLLDASDAAAILVYAAAHGSGSDLTWEQVLGTS